MFRDSGAFRRYTVFWPGCSGIRWIILMSFVLVPAITFMTCLLFLVVVLHVLFRRLAFVCPAFCILKEVQLCWEFSVSVLGASFSLINLRFRWLTTVPSKIMIGDVRCYTHTLNKCTSFLNLRLSNAPPRDSSWNASISGLRLEKDSEGSTSLCKYEKRQDCHVHEMVVKILVQCYVMGACSAFYITNLDFAQKMLGLMLYVVICN